MKKRTVLTSTLLLIIFCSIASLFWYQESRYLLPTPVPAHYRPVAIGQRAENIQEVSAFLQPGKPVLLHFFNPDCPCSRFNMKHFSKLVKQYEQQFTFIAILQTTHHKQAASLFQEKYELPIPVIVDSSKKIASAYGIYATPQAVILHENGQIYYRGNYNRSRYCTNKDSNFAQMAMDSLVAGKPAPHFIEIASQAYGCELPDTSQHILLTEIFN